MRGKVGSCVLRCGGVLHAAPEGHELLDRRHRSLHGGAIGNTEVPEGISSTPPRHGGGT